MNNVSQGDVIKLAGYRNSFLVVSKNSFIKSTGMFHVCPLLHDVQAGPVHIRIDLIQSKTSETAICEQVKLIDPSQRSFSIVDRISYPDKMEVSDAIQGIFEYD